MPGTKAARRYARAVFDLARAQGAEEQVGAELAQLATVFAEPELAKLLALPTLPLKARQDSVERIVTTLSPHPLVSNFLRVLAENDRLGALTEIESAYQHILERALGRVRAVVRSASSLSQEEMETLIGVFSRLTGRTVIPTVKLEPELLGGVVVEVEGRVYDASLKTQLQRMEEALAQRL